jgi:Gpi18-like mannosyltransferase
MSSFLKRIKRLKVKRYFFPLGMLFLLLAGFLLRIYFVPEFTEKSGDLLLYADWGEKFWEYGSKNFYYVDKWYYAPPNYPPISLIYGASYWLFDHKYILAQIHNTIKIIPAVFIVYFYEHGYFLLLKLPAILADLGLAFLIYKLVLKFTKDKKKSLLGMVIYLFNPVSVFLSGIWGQTDSLIAIFALLSFISLASQKTAISLPLFFISLYIKPNWVAFIPLYIFLLFIKQVKLREVFVGGLLSLIIFFITTRPFAKDNVINFSRWLLETRILPTASVAQKASVSAFNFYTTFLQIDYDLESTRLFGVPLSLLGILFFLVINLAVFAYLKKQKASLHSVMVGIFTIGFGSYLFLTNMLERYFFASFVPMIILVLTKPRTLVWGILINLAVFANLFYSFFRRSLGKVGDVFGDNNFLPIRILSAANVFAWVMFIRALKVYKKGDR